MTAPTLADDDEPYVSAYEQHLIDLRARHAHRADVARDIDAMRAERRNRTNQ